MSFSEWVSSIADDVPLVEGNAEQRPRAIILKGCSITFNKANKKSRRMTLLSESSRMFSHWALEIGDYSYDLRVKDRHPYRYIVSRIPGLDSPRAFEFNIKPVFHTHSQWKAETGGKERKPYKVGTTSLSDVAINDVAHSIIDNINSEGGFHKLHNNCQIFSKCIARIIDPVSKSIEQFTDSSTFMKRFNNVSKLAALCAQDALTELRVKNMPKKLERFFDDDTDEDAEVARVFLDAVKQIGASAELIDQSDKRWTSCKVEQPQFLAPLFERKRIFNFSDAKTIAAHKAAMAYGSGGLVGQGVNVSGWQDSRDSLRAAINSPIEINPYISDQTIYRKPVPPPRPGSRLVGTAGGGPVVQSMPRLEGLSRQNKDFMI